MKLQRQNTTLNLPTPFSYLHLAMMWMLAVCPKKSSMPKIILATALEIISINSPFPIYCMLALRSRIGSANLVQIFMINQMSMIKLLKSLTVYKRFLLNFNINYFFLAYT